MKRFKRFLAVFMTLAMILSFMPAMAFADGWSVTGSGEDMGGNSYQTKYTGSPVPLTVTVTGNTGTLRYLWEHEVHTQGGTEEKTIQDGTNPTVMADEPGWYGCSVYEDGEYRQQVIFTVYTNDTGYGGGDDSWSVTGNGECRNGMYYVKLSGGKAHLEVTIQGNNDSPSYKWEREIVKDEGTEYSFISGANGPSVEVSEPGWYCCYIYENGSDQSEVDFRVYVPVVKKGDTASVSGSTYKVTAVAKGSSQGTVAITKAKNTKSVTIPATVTIEGKKYKVTQVNASAFKGSKIRTVTVSKNIKKISSNAFKGSKATKLVIKSKNLTKTSVKGSLKNSKVKTVQVKVGSKAENKKYIKKYKKYFTKANAGKKVSVK